jgi:L-iditol 2-dehydrogenase
MKSIVLTGIRSMEMVEKPIPKISHPGAVLIQMDRVGVCGSDIHYYTDGKIGSQVVQYPFTVGHEGAGTVCEVGSGVLRIKPGDRVAIDPAMPCFGCDQCLSGRFHTCRKLLFLGCPGQAEGCLSDYIVMPEHSCFVLPATMSFDEAVVSEPLAIGYYAIASGASSTYVTDKIEERLQMARQSGATWAGNPDIDNIVDEISKREPLLLDYVFECCGKQEAADQAIKLLKPGGKLLIIGIPEFDYWHFPADDFRRKEIVVQNVRRQNESTSEALELIASGRVDVKPMITHHYPLENSAIAFEDVSNYRDGVMKAMITF